MIKTIALVVIFGFSGMAAAGYKEAGEALKNLDAPEAQKELDSLLASPGAALARDARAAALLKENQPAMELFRQAAEEPGDGYLFAPKPEKHNSKTPLPKFAIHLKLLKLLLIDAKIQLAHKQPGPAEKDLLAAAGFILQLSAQKSAVMLSSMVQQLCLHKASPALSLSLTNPSVSPAYLKEFAARLEKIYKNQDFMKSALLDEAEMFKGSMVDGVNPEAMEAENAKLSFLKRLGAKKLQDQEFFSTVYGSYNAAIDAHTKVLIEAFRANDNAPAVAFIEKREQETKARKQAYEKVGFFSQVMDGLRGGPKVKKIMAEVIVDTTLSSGTPSYEKLIPRYHLYLSELNVYRAALALKLFQRARRRLPDSLDQLVPAYLEAAPQDPFNKFSPVSYIKAGKKFMVYSFGPDGRDGEGAAALDYDAYAENPARDAGDMIFSDLPKTQ